MTDLAGIGDVLGKRLAGKGFDRVRTVNINYSGHADGSMELFLSGLCGSWAVSAFEEE